MNLLRAARPQPATLVATGLLQRRLLATAGIPTLLVALAGAAGCSTLPSGGPTVSDIRDEAKASTPAPFRLVDLSRSSLEVLRRRPLDGFSTRFGEGGSSGAATADLPASDPLVGAGDGLTINLWETGANPLFSGGAGGGSATSASSAAGRAMSLPEQVVGSDGTVFVPFAGRIAAAGRTLSQIQSSIEAALRGKTQTPQVLVTLSHPEANVVLVLGEAAAGRRYPLGPQPARLLDVLADVGGSRVPVYETRVRLTRDGVTAELPMAQILADPAQNLRLQAGDQLTVTKKADTYTVFGATGRNAQVPFEGTQVNLIEALARAGGLLDQRSDPAGVYLLRYEPPMLAQALPASNAGAPDGTSPEAPADAAAAVPVVYHLDLLRADSYFLGQDFAMRDHDVLYVASAAANQLQKFLTLVGLISQPVIQGVILQQTTN